MALPPAALRYRKSVKYFILALLVFFLIMMVFTVFVLRATKADTREYIGYLLSMLLVGFLSQRMYKRYTSTDPVLVFTSDGLVTPMNGNRFIPWSVINEWKIRRDKSSYSLVIRTPQGKTRVDVSWLDASAEEIKRMMETYIRQPGPHGAMW